MFLFSQAFLRPSDRPEPGFSVQLHGPPGRGAAAVHAQVRCSLITLRPNKFASAGPDFWALPGNAVLVRQSPRLVPGSSANFLATNSQRLKAILKSKIGARKRVVGDALEKLLVRGALENHSGKPLLKPIMEPA